MRIEAENAEEAVCRRVPDLYHGELFNETASSAATSTRHYSGTLVNWGDFASTVKKWFLSKDTQKLFKDCEGLPLGVAGSPSPFFRDNENLIQSGSEITLSSRFLKHIYEPVLSASLTMIYGARISTGWRPNPLPLWYPDWAGGDMKIIPRQGRDEKQQPDLVLKHIRDNKTTRMKVEVQCVNNGDLRDILAQIVNYMLKYRTKYGFMSTYEYTVFLKIDDDKVHFSSPVAHSAEINKSNYGDFKAITVRLGLLWLIHKSTGEEEAKWKLSDSTVTKLQGYISAGQSTTNIARGTPSTHRDDRGGGLLTSSFGRLNLGNGSEDEDEDDDAAPPPVRKKANSGSNPDPGTPTRSNFMR